MSLRIAIFDDNKNIRDSIRLLLNTVPDFEVVGLFSHGLDCVQDVKSCTPDVVLMDIEMPGVTGIEAVRTLIKEMPHIQILMQTVFEDDDRVFDSICAGASGYILKIHLNTRLLDAVRELQYGGSPMSPAIARKVMNKLQQIPHHVRPEQAPDYNLTPREKDVLACVVEGLSNRMIFSQDKFTF